jgi:exosome complex component MTR3
LDVTITVLEAEDDRWWGDASGSSDASWGMMNVLAGCITAAAAAIADARIDCLDLVAGGVAALVAEDEESDSTGGGSRPSPRLLLDPDPSEHQNIVAACVVGYLPGRDEVTEIWLKGDTSEVASTTRGEQKMSGHDILIDGAVDAARAARSVLAVAVRESGERFIAQSMGVSGTTKAGTDIEMKT